MIIFFFIIPLAYMKNILYSYRIKHAMEINVPQDVNYNIEHLISKKIVRAINIHRQAITWVLTDYKSFFTFTNIFS